MIHNYHSQTASPCNDLSFNNPNDQELAKLLSDPRSQEYSPIFFMVSKMYSKDVYKIVEIMCKGLSPSQARELQKAICANYHSDFKNNCTGIRELKKLCLSSESLPDESKISYYVRQYFGFDEYGHIKNPDWYINIEQDLKELDKSKTAQIFQRFFLELKEIFTHSPESEQLNILLEKAAAPFEYSAENLSVEDAAHQLLFCRLKSLEQISLVYTDAINTDIDIDKQIQKGKEKNICSMLSFFYRWAAKKFL